MKKIILLAFIVSTFICYLIHLEFASLKGIYVIEDGCHAILRNDSQSSIGDTIYVKPAKPLVNSIKYDWYSTEFDTKKTNDIKIAVVTNN